MVPPDRSLRCDADRADSVTHRPRRGFRSRRNRRMFDPLSASKARAMNENLDKNAVVNLLNRILEQELAGVVRYTHYSFLVFGYSRIPILSWLREQAAESLLHAQQAGEMITLLGAYPSLAIGPLLDSHKHDIGTIMREALHTEGIALSLYRELLAAVEGCSVMLEEYARQMIYAEELHAGEVDKMLRRPGELAAFSGV
ncbi:MAG: hypothetical protein JWM38_2079 [Sphingomonas bacterium]|nr:hypothetical protein [Sphingomonas bacterium]